MNKKVVLKLLSLAVLFFSCNSEESEVPNEIVPPQNTLPKSIKIHYSQDDGVNFLSTYTGVKIGEYYWMNSNFTEPFEHDITKVQIDNILKIYEIDPAHYPITVSDFHKYYGQYYSRTYIEYMSAHGRMYEGDDKIKNTVWQLPSKDDFRQLFGMCGNGQLLDVLTFLVCKPNEVPVALPVVGWFSPLNSNRYDFNLLPGGARYHGETPEVFKIKYPDGREKSFSLTKGDLYNFSQVASFVCVDGTVSIHDYPDTSGGKLWHWLNMRWCRKLTDEELGYRLYINTNQTDIRKLGLDDTVPSGYAELPKGYIRGLYVQYILDNPKPEKTVSQIVAMAKDLR